MQKKSIHLTIDVHSVPVCQATTIGVCLFTYSERISNVRVSYVRLQLVIRPARLDTLRLLRRIERQEFDSYMMRHENRPDCTLQMVD